MQGGPFGGGMFQVPTGYDEDAIGRALRAMQQDAPANPALTHAPSQGAHPPPHLPQIPMQQLQMPPGQQPPMQQQMAGTSPQLTEMFLAALPYLQFLQQQQQQSPTQLPQPPPPHPPHPPQQQPQPQHPMQHNPFGMPPRPPSQPPRQQTFDFMAQLPPHQQQQQGQVSHSFSAGHFGTLPAPELSSPAGGMMPPPPPPPPGQASLSNTPSPEANPNFEPTEGEAVAIAEDKRRRNTAASGVYIPVVRQCYRYRVVEWHSIAVHHLTICIVCVECFSHLDKCVGRDGMTAQYTWYAWAHNVAWPVHYES